MGPSVTHGDIEALTSSEIRGLRNTEPRRLNPGFSVLSVESEPYCNPAVIHSHWEKGLAHAGVNAEY